MALISVNISSIIFSLLRRKAPYESSISSILHLPKHSVFDVVKFTPRICGRGLFLESFTE